MTRSTERINLFSPTELEDFYGVPIFDDHQQTHYFALNKQDKKFIEQFSNTEDKVYWVLSLGYFRAKHSLIDFNHKQTIKDRRYIMDTYFPSENTPKNLPSNYRKLRIQNRILKHEKYLRCTSKIKYKLQIAMRDLIKKHPKARPLAKALLQYMVTKNIALPSYRIIQDLITKTIAYENKRLERIIAKNLTTAARTDLDKLLTEDSDVYHITAIKQDAKDFSFTETNKEINKSKLMRSIYNFAEKIFSKLDLPMESIRYYGSLINFYNAYKLNRMRPKQTYLYLICYVYSRQQKINDNLVQCFHFYVRQYHEEATVESNKLILEEKIEESDLYAKTSKVLQLFIDDNIKNEAEFGMVRHRAFKILAREKIPVVQSLLTNDKLSKKYFYWNYIDGLYNRITKNLRPLFKTIYPLIEADKKIAMLTKILQQIIEDGIEIVKENELTGLIPENLYPYLLENDEEKSKLNLVNVKRLEFYIYYKLHQQIKSFNAFVKGSLNYQSMRDELISEKTWEKDGKKILKKSGSIRALEPIDKILIAHQKELDPMILSVNERIKKGENNHIKIAPPNNKWTLPYQPKEDSTNNPFFLKLPQLSIVDILYFVNQKCNFTKHFTPIQGRYTKQDRSNKLVFAAITANAIRAGTYKMASISDVTFSELSTTEKTYIRLETLRSTIDCINNATAKLPIFKHWYINDMLHSGIDGSKIGTRLHNIKARHSSKYFGLGRGVSSYNMVVNHLPINARLIGANEHESHFLFDIIRSNSSIILPDRHSGDGHSLNQVNFALLDFIAHEFMPYFPQIHKKKIYCFGHLSKFEDCLIKPTQQIKTNLIATEWPNVLHIIASLLQGTTSQNIIVRKLSSSDYRNKTKDALWEYDNILRSIYILKCIDDVTVRQSVRKVLNRTEAYHQLCRAIALVNNGKFRGKSEVELAIWNDCARLVACAIIFYNAYILSVLLQRKEVSNDEKNFKLITELSPVAW